MHRNVVQIAISSVREKFYALLPKLNSSDGIILSVGIGALVVGLLVDIFLLRLMCLLIVLSSGVLLAVVFHLRRTTGPAPGRETNSSIHPQSDQDGMKKLVFDDFQTNLDGKYNIGEVSQREADQKSFRQPAQSQTENGRIPEDPPYMGKISHGDARNAAREYKISDFFDVGSDIYKGDAEPRAEFDFLLLKVLTVIKEVLFAHSAAFFWANREKKQMVLETKLSDSSSFITGCRFPFGHDLLSKVALTGQPELVTEVNPRSERELLPYYDVAVSIRSFVGVPVYFTRSSSGKESDQPVGVIIVDNKAADEFGEETLSLLGNFTKLVSALIKSYTDKYDLLVDAELLRSIRRLQERIRNNISQSTIVQALADETSKLVNWDYLSIVLFDEVKRAWVTKKVTSRGHQPYVSPDQVIDFPESIVGQTIRQNAHTMVDDLETMMPPRYHSGERLESKGSFISIPLTSLNKCYGALNLESREKYNFSRRDIDMLYRLADNTASALEVLYLNEVINEYVIIDGGTGMYARKFFMQKVGEELQRADETGCDLSMLFVTIDRSQDIVDRYGTDGFERVVATVAKAIRASVRPYDVVGRCETNRFGVLLIDTASSDAYLWAERIRKNIAGHVINLDGKTFSVTISTGVCGTLEGMRKEDLLGNTVAVLNRAAEAGGNTVRVF